MHTDFTAIEYIHLSSEMNRHGLSILAELIMRHASTIKYEKL